MTPRSWLIVERIYGDTPDLNSVEALWGNLKGIRSADLCVDIIADTEYLAPRGVRRVGKEGNGRSRSFDARFTPLYQCVTTLSVSQYVISGSRSVARSENEDRDENVGVVNSDSKFSGPGVTGGNQEGGGSANSNILSTVANHDVSLHGGPGIDLGSPCPVGQPDLHWPTSHHTIADGLRFGQRQRGVRGGIKTAVNLS